VRLEGLEAALVDLDGTLVDTAGDFVAALNAMLDDLGRPRIDRPLVERLIGKGADHIVREALAAAGAAEPGPALFERARQLYRDHYVAINGRHSSVYPGVEEGLAAFAEPLLRATRLDRHFEQVCCGDRHGRLKPDPLPLLRTCELLHARPERTLVIGDSTNDVRAARAAGCPVLLVTYGYNHGEPARAAGADGYLDSLAQIVTGVTGAVPVLGAR
jgi:phosphoglycolate phosphatase